MIQVMEQGKTFHLKTAVTSMILHVLDSGHPVCLYWGRRVEDETFSYIIKEIQRASYLSDTDGVRDFKLEQMPLLYPAYGNPDMRTPVFQFQYEDGSRITDLRFEAYRSGMGKKKLKGLPCSWGGGSEVLILLLQDAERKLTVELEFAVFEFYDVITESVRVTNGGQETVAIEKLLSACFSFLDDKMDCITLTGAWGRECHMSRQSLRQGCFVLDSKRGASGHGQNPFLALASPGADEVSGDIYAMNLVYSGSFEAVAEVDMHQNTRMMLGINSFDFRWQLEPGEVFQSPEAVMVYSGEGFGGMSRRFHRFYRECLMKSLYVKKPRPVLLNNWEATYFEFDRKTLLRLAEEAAGLGVELFVLDDGWFGERDSDEASLGDWTANEKKLGGSLAELAGDIRKLGLEFGLWFEPEMVSQKSRLYQTHPDWIIRVPGREPQLARHQYVLDLSRVEVQDMIIEAVGQVLENAPVSYVKWDMNRNITDIGSDVLPPERQKEVPHRYILGLYRILEVLTERFPAVLFEGCAGGGGRFDPGILYYMPQIWASDDTDAIGRLEIQYGTSLVYPAAAMGCHVSACPNHQVGRVTSLRTRGTVAMAGVLGYELDLLKLGQEEKRQIRQQIAFYKEIRETVQAGTLFRLKEEADERAWMYVSADGSQAVVSDVRVLARANTVPKRLRLTGLEPDAVYQICRVWEEAVGRLAADGAEGTGAAEEVPVLRYGSVLMYIGIGLPNVKEDFTACQWVLKKKAEILPGKL